MSQCLIDAPAKINSWLEILGRDHAGYHLLETIFITLDLADTLAIERVSSGVKLALEDAPADCPTGPENLVVRAANAWLAASQGDFGVHITLTKRIPSGAGLGGGSSDAAAVLRALQLLSDNPLPPEILHQIAANLGSDVPFFLLGGCAHATGRGEVLTPLEDPDPQPLTLIDSGIHCATPAIFAELTEAERGPRPALGPAQWAERLARGPDQHCYNRLAAPACRLHPGLAECLEWCASTGRPSHLSGSGGVCVVWGHVEVPNWRHWHSWTRPRTRLNGQA